MGVVHKLKPEIIDFILKQKEKQARLSCRKLTVLIQEKFQTKISKSHVNAVIKKAGLSSKIGRTPKPKRGITEADDFGFFLLKAADSLVGGTATFQGMISARLNDKAINTSFLDALVYGLDSPFWKLTGKPYQQEALEKYLACLEEDKSLNREIADLLPLLFQDILFLRITFSDGSVFYLDGQFFTLWSSPYIPYDFSTTSYKIKSYIRKYFRENQPMIIFSAPGFESTHKDWFDFLVKLNSPERTIIKVSLLDPNLQELESITLQEANKYYFIFGLWPWQYTKSRQIESLGEPKRFHFPGQKYDFALEKCRVILSQSNTNQVLELNGAALKKNPGAKPDIFILSNLSTQVVAEEEIAEMYLNRWPNLQAGFEDFSRKIELFTYSASSRRAFPTERLLLNKTAETGLKGTLSAYRLGLDNYVRWYFLPQEYKEKDFPTVKERFYRLKARVKKKKGAYLVNFVLPPDYAYLKELNYAIARMNEKEIMLPEGRRVWFAVL